MLNKSIYNSLKKFYPLSYSSNKLPLLLSKYFSVLNKKVLKKDDARISGKFGKDYYETLINKYSVIPYRCKNPIMISEKIVSDFFQGVVRWRSPNLEHNVGSPVHTISSAIYSLAMDENIYNIDDGLTGNALASEFAVARILSNLAELDSPGAGFFTFGGTGTNLYSVKMGLKKCFQDSGKKGTPKNVKIITTEDSHFSHALSADWLGIGTDNVVVVKSKEDRTSCITDAKNKIDSLLKSGNIIPVIMINGGTTYLQTIDNVIEFVRLRDYFVKKYSLNYKPHLHVDTVIGWSWLFFNQYDFKKNKLQISQEPLKLIKKQNFLLKGLKYADSWGVDFHKGIGSCPVPCSFIMFNNARDLDFLSKTGDPLLETHQLASELNYFSPADFTLETSRPGGASLAALATLHSLGVEGFQRNLANLVECKVIIKNQLKNKPLISLIEENCGGFSVLVRIYPPELEKENLYKKEFKLEEKKSKELIEYTNNYIKKFYLWDYKNRILKNNGPSYAFSSSIFKIKENKISAIKIYPTSPHFNKHYAIKTAKLLISQKKIFDNEVWKKKT
jgi:L-2,4-diaminobutyrate decarboxylase